MSESTETIITAELRRCIGQRGPLCYPEPLNASDIRRYVDATGDANPLWMDDEYARSIGYKGRLLPPILVGWTPFSLKEPGKEKDAPFDVRRQLPTPTTYTNVRNTGSEAEWLKPVHFGEPLSCQSHIVDIEARKGKMNVGIYVTQLEEVHNEMGELVFTRRHTVALFPERSVRD